MKSTKSLYDKGPNDLEFKINSLKIENENLKRINQKLTNDIAQTVYCNHEQVASAPDLGGGGGRLHVGHHAHGLAAGAGDHQVALGHAHPSDTGAAAALARRRG